MAFRKGANTGGPIPKFTDYHLWKALMALNEEEPIGRGRLSELLGIGEGSTRTIIGMMDGQGFIQIGRRGILLTPKGAQFRKKVSFDVAPVMTSDLTINTSDCAVRIPYAARKITFGCEERDEAIKAGATGATTLICKNGSLIFPGSDYPVSSTMERTLRDKFDIRNDDVIIIGTAGNPHLAELGAVSAALNVVGGLDFSDGIGVVLSSRSTASEILSLAFAVHDLIGGYPVCAKSRYNLGIRIENGVVIDNAYTGEVLEEAIEKATTIRRVATSGPYKGTKVIATPLEVNGKVVAAIGVVDLRGLAEGIFRD